MILENYEHRYLKKSYMTIVFKMGYMVNDNKE